MSWRVGGASLSVRKLRQSPASPSFAEVKNETRVSREVWDPLSPTRNAFKPGLWHLPPDFQRSPAHCDPVKFKFYNKERVKFGVVPSSIQFTKCFGL